MYIYIYTRVYVYMHIYMYIYDMYIYIYVCVYDGRYFSPIKIKFSKNLKTTVTIEAMIQCSIYHYHFIRVELTFVDEMNFAVGCHM
jgi:hypothetical protein